MAAPPFPGGVWFVDFEFHPAHGREGNPPVPVCMVAREFATGRTLHLWQDDLARLEGSPFPVDQTSLFVAYYASAEIGCFIALGWEMPVNVVDLYAEFRCLTNGKALLHGSGLLGALAWYGLDALAGDEKSHWRDKVLEGGPWSPADRAGILAYCESDVDALARLWVVMLDKIDWPRALLRGRYPIAAAHIEATGVPIDVHALSALESGWPGIRLNLVAAVDADFGVYDGTTFKADRFERLLAHKGISWPRLPSGHLDLDQDTFRDLVRTHPGLAGLHDLRSTLAQMRSFSLQVGDDGRNRYLLSMFKAKTGRNQPSSTKSIFGPAKWLRGLMRPKPGYGLAYIDWSQQEFGIAAALSGDAAMMEAYRSGDPYLAFAKQAGAAPADATKQTHAAIRGQFKACVLAVQYGMGAETLAYRINCPVARARELLELHHQAYRRFWAWSDGVLNYASLSGRLWTVFGWYLDTSQSNRRSICNFPVQANGAEMLRMACVMLVKAGVKVCAPVHDAVLIEAPLADLDAVVAEAQAVMRAASATVLDGFALESDAKIVRWPARYMDESGVAIWNEVMGRLGLNDRRVEE